MDLIKDNLMFIRKLISLMIIIMTVVTLYFPAPEDNSWVFNEAGNKQPDFFPDFKKIF